MHLTITHGGVIHANLTAEDAAARGIPLAEITAALDAALIEQAEHRIDALCDAVYTRSPSRTARYEQKHAEALRYVAAGYPGSVAEADYPYLVNEAPARELTKRDLADLVIARAAAFNLLGAAAESARAGLAGAITAAPDESAKRAAAEALIATVQTAAEGA